MSRDRQGVWTRPLEGRQIVSDWSRKTLEASYLHARLHSKENVADQRDRWRYRETVWVGRGALARCREGRDPDRNLILVQSNHWINGYWPLVFDSFVPACDSVSKTVGEIYNCKSPIAGYRSCFLSTFRKLTTVIQRRWFGDDVINSEIAQECFAFDNDFCLFWQEYYSSSPMATYRSYTIPFFYQFSTTPASKWLSSAYTH